MTEICKGIITEEECRGHKYVEWEVEYLTQPELIFISPIIKIDAREYIFELHDKSSELELNFLCKDVPTNNEVRCYMGVKCADRTYYHIIATPETKKNDSIVCTDFYDTWTVENALLDTDDHLTFFVRVDAVCPQDGTKTCKHGYTDIITTGEGCIREENCSGHKHVEWVVEYELLQEEISNSPPFMMGAQRYLLELRTSANIFLINLFRMGPSVEHNVRIICGIKRRDGSYDHKVEIRDLILLENCEMWRSSGTIYDIDRFGKKSRFCNANEKVSFFVRMDDERTESGGQTCIHGVAQMTPSGKGHIREEKCSDHIQVEWNFECELKPRTNYALTSPVFEIEGQRYLMDCTVGNNYAALHLFSTSRTSKSQVRFFLGAKHKDGSYYHRTGSGLLDEENDYDVWQLEGDAYLVLPATYLKSDILSSDGHLKFFVRIHVEHSPFGPRTCTHDMSVRGVGTVEEVEWATYKQVDWNAVCEPSSRTVTSPSFSVGDQHYLWELSWKGEGNSLLKLYRMGPAVSKSVRWWSFIKRKDEIDGHHVNKCEKLDLENGTYGMWKPVGIPLAMTNDQDGKGPLIVRTLMTLERTTTSLSAPTPADDQSQQDFKPVPGEDAVFIVDNREFKMHRAVLEFRVPAFEVMFLHDFTEKRSGVVRIIDCEPDIFKLFLDFVYSGKVEIVTSLTCFALFSVADKYLFHELKHLCLLKIEEVIVSMDNFFDIVKFTFIHTNGGLLRKATNFLSENKDIFKTETWRDFSTKHSDAANSFLLKASLPLE